MTIDMLIYYDSFDNRAALFFTEGNKRVRELMFYDKNEIISSYGKKT